MRTITIEMYRTDPIDRALANGVIAQAGLNPDDIESIDVHVDRFVLHCIRRPIVVSEIDGELDRYRVEVQR